MTLLRPFGPSIYTVEGPELNFLGFPYPTRMVIIKLKDGSAWIWSPISLTDALIKELQENELDVKHIVSPNKIHHIFLKEWQEQYPGALVYGPPGLSERNIVKGVRFDIELDNDDENTNKNPYSEDIDQVIFHGSFFMEEIVFYHRLSKTAIFGDLIQRHPESQMKGWKGMLMKMDGIVGKEGSTPKDWRFSFRFGGRQRALEARDEILTWGAENLIIAHGDCQKGGASGVISKALDWV